MDRFNEIYEEVYKKNALPLEEMRKKARNINILSFCICIPLGIILMFVFNHSLFFILGIVIYIGIISFSKNNNNYKKYFKENVIRSFVKEYSEKLNYNPYGKIFPATYDEGEFEYYDSFKSEDLITGTLLNDYKIEMAEVHTERRDTDSDGNTSYTTVFHGLFGKIIFDKTIDVNMKIRRNAISLFNKKNKLEMDSGEFEKKFDVFTTNKIITMQLLTADIMQMLLDFKEKNKVTPEITLKQNYLYIRFSTGDMFEASLLKNSLDYEKLKKYYDTINFTLDITEKFLKNISETDV